MLKAAPDMSRCFNAAPPEVCPGPPVHGGPKGPMLHCPQGPAVCDCRPGQEVYTLDHRNQDDRNGIPGIFDRISGRCGKMWEDVGRKSNQLGLQSEDSWDGHSSDSEVLMWTEPACDPEGVPGVATGAFLPTFSKSVWLCGVFFGSTLEYQNFTRATNKFYHLVI